MVLVRNVSSRGILMGRLPYGSDLLEALTAVCRREGISLGRVEALGAVQRARLAFYSQEAREYRFFVVNQPLEIAALHGNISTKDGAPFLHAHLVLSDGRGKTYGGHLAEGTETFACEYLVEALSGPALLRAPDEQTGLALWQGEGEEA